MQNARNSLCKILEIVYAKNSKQFLWENSE